MKSMKTKPQKFEVWIADLNPQRGTEAGKIRPVVIIQSNLLNEHHPSTLVCPITTNVIPESYILRVNIPKGTAQLTDNSDIMIDQIRAIDNNRLMKKVGILPSEITEKISENLAILLDL